MARDKVRAGGLIEAAAWSVIGAGILAAAYEVSALIAHCGTWVHWR